MSFLNISPSPLRLIQECFPDPWEHILCCICCCRTTGSSVVRSVIGDLLSYWKTPSDIINAGDAELQQVLFPLGLQEMRAKSLKRMSTSFLLDAWDDPIQFYGCGKFISDSWRIFCRGDRSMKNVQDKNLRRYLSWLLQEDGPKKEQAQGNPEKVGSSSSRKKRTRGGKAFGMEGKPQNKDKILTDRKLRKTALCSSRRSLRLQSL
mmetsp:Transcript_23757/g.56630  ORF Transcript_23757/g.56630 Transcript_23757/m.56630 type:complete len:206 (+) Transcript_23757:588-1205(+)